MTRHAGLVLLALLVGVGTVVPESGPERGSVTVTPAVGMAGNYGTWTVTWRVGTHGVATGAESAFSCPTRGTPATATPPTVSRPWTPGRITT